MHVVNLQVCKFLSIYFFAAQIEKKTTVPLHYADVLKLVFERD